MSRHISRTWRGRLKTFYNTFGGAYGNAVACMFIDLHSLNICSVPTGVMLQVSHGYDVRGGDDSYLRAADQTIKNYGVAGRFGAWAVDVIPVCELMVLLRQYLGPG